MSNKWDEFIETPSKKFGYEVPIFTPSIYREYRGEIFTTFHSEEHPVMKHIHYEKSEISIHGRFSKSYKGVLRGLHYDNKTWKLFTCISGKVQFGFINYNKKSKNFKKNYSFILSENSNKQIHSISSFIDNLSYSSKTSPILAIRNPFSKTVSEAVLLESKTGFVWLK